jgi:hypothetical protein
MGVLNQKSLLIHIWFWVESPFPFIEALSRGLGTTALILVSNAHSMLSRWKNENLDQGELRGRDQGPAYNLCFCFQSYLQDSLSKSSGGADGQ